MPIAHTPPTPPFPVEFWQTNTSPDIAKCLSNKITPWLRTTALQCIHSGYKNNPLITETRLCTTSANTWPIDFHYHSGKKKKKSQSPYHSVLALHDLLPTITPWTPVLFLTPVLTLLQSYLPLYYSSNTPTKLSSQSPATFPLCLQFLFHDIHLASYTFRP